MATSRHQLEADLTQRIAAIAAIGAQGDGNGDGAGGVTRLAYSPEERAAHELAVGWMRAAGLTVRRDAAGNLFGRWSATAAAGSRTRTEGAQEDAAAARAPVWTGSHLDTVPHGGDYDGVAGVLTSLAAVERLQAGGFVPVRPIEVCVFVGEEGSRYPGLLGSRAVAQGLPPSQLSARDANGVTLAEAMQSAGLDPERVGDARLMPGDVHAFLELHIEQGPVLEAADAPVGIVTGVAGPLEIAGTVRGQADHAGTTPMNARHDSLLAVAELALFAERLAREASSSTVATVGRVETEPGAANVVAATTRFTLDLRDTDGARRDRVEAALREEFARILARRGLRGELHDLMRVAPVPVPEAMLTTIRQAAHRLQLENGAAACPELPSGAGHDAMVMAGLCPSGMVFVRSIGGRSHCPEERSSQDDLALGAALLAETLRELAGPPSA